MFDIIWFKSLFLCNRPGFSFGWLILQFVGVGWNNYCGYQKKQYLCSAVDSRVLLKLSQLNWLLVLVLLIMWLV